MNLMSGTIGTTHRRNRPSRWDIVEDPMGYLDGQNLFQFVGSEPVGKSDPLGLSSWDTSTIEPISDPLEFWGDVPLPDPMLPTPGGKGFYPDYISHPGWSLTVPDPEGQWVNTGPGTFEFRGKILSNIRRLVLPKNLPACVDQAALREAVDAFNDKAYQHELEVQEWHVNYVSTPKPATSAADAAAKFHDAIVDRFGSQAQWEKDELQVMYGLLENAYNMSRCPGSPDDSKVDFDKVYKRHGITRPAGTRPSTQTTAS